MYLNCHTHYSFRYGTLSEEDLLTLAAQHGLSQVALTDVNNTSACLNFIRLAPRFNIKPVIGIDFRHNNRQHFIGLAKNNDGFTLLNDFLSTHLHNDKAPPTIAPPLDDVVIIYPFATYDRQRPLADNEHLGVGLADINRLTAARHAVADDKMVFLHTVSFKEKEEFSTHRILRAIDNNTLLTKLDKQQQGQYWHRMYPQDIIKTKIPRHQYLIKNTEKLLDQCHVDFDFSRDRPSQNQISYTGNIKDDTQLVQQLCWEGLSYRYGEDVTDEIIQRMHKELDLICKMNFLSYFLINWDITEYARQCNYFYVGRGSGANSIVAYLLGITDVDPIELDLYFERFINLYRKNAPDFDIDFSWRDREDVTRYIFERYPHTSLLATYNTFQFKGAVREVGKVMGLPAREISRISGQGFDARQADAPTRNVLHWASRIMGKPNHLGIHAGGILISEQPIHYFSATHMPPKGFPTVQFDMVVAEDVGLYKFDILGQRGLAKIKEALEIVSYNQPTAPVIDIHDIRPLKKDPAIAHMISRAHCLGCFYVESPAMRMLLRKLEVDNYLGLVAASSIIRPGVAKSGMMREYILRHKDPKRCKEKAHPVLYDLMPETYGVMVYQEDVIKVAHYFAGLTLGEADVLRRGMSGKYRSRDEFEKVKNTFIDNCVKKGHSLQVTKEVWRQIESFAGYAFSKGHSASYAVESYQSLFLKVHYPLEYMVAVVNNGGGFYRPEVYIHEARMLGATIHAPCVNRGSALTLIDGKYIYLGLGMIKYLTHESIRRILTARRDDVFHDLLDFIERTGITLDQIIILIRIKALRFTKLEKKELLWKSHLSLSKAQAKPVMPQLFRAKPKNYKLPNLPEDHIEDAYDEMELIGFPLCSPFLLIHQGLTSRIKAANLERYTGERISTLGYLVTVKKTKTSNGKLMYFGTFLDEDGAFLDTVHFPPVAIKFPFRGRGIYKISGVVTEEFDFCSIEVEQLQKINYIDDPRYVLPPYKQAKKSCLVCKPSDIKKS